MSRFAARIAEHAGGAEPRNHVLGGERIAVVEHHPLAQLQLHRAVVGAVPGRGEPRFLGKVAAPVHLDQALVEHHRGALADIGVLAQIVEGVRVGDALHGDGDARPRIRLGDGEAWQGCGGGKKARRPACDLAHVTGLLRGYMDKQEVFFF